MRLKKIAMAVAAASLATAPVLAQSSTDGTSSDTEEGFGQGGYLALFAIVALVIGVGFAGGNNNNNPVSA